MSVVLKNVSSYIYTEPILQNISMEIEDNIILSVLSPHSKEKNAFIKLFNRLDETQRGYKFTGDILINGQNIKNINVQNLRRKVGFIFAQPVALPGTVKDNLSFGLNIQGIQDEKLLTSKIEEVLKSHQLWEYLNDKMDIPARELKIFHLQLLALARVLVLNPEILIFQQPTQFLSEVAARRFEGIISLLKTRYTIIIGTSSIQKARRISDYTVFVYNGKLIEFDKTQTIFTYPKQELTENYIRGKFE